MLCLTGSLFHVGFFIYHFYIELCLVSHILCNDETWHSNTLPKEDPEYILIM